MFSSNASQVSDSATYIEDVFSTYLYTGNGSTQTINNGIDLAGEGGLVWVACRSNAQGNYMTDTVRGATKQIAPFSTAAQNTESTGLTSFSSTGFTVGSKADWNFSNYTYASWTFRKQPKFFDVVTYTGNGATQNIAHSLGSVPGSIIVKKTNDTANWQVYHRSLANTQCLVLNSTSGTVTSATRWNSTTPTSTVFSVGNDSNVNGSGSTYVAYLFAHDAGGFGESGEDNVISCGSYTAVNGTSLNVNLGFEPQWLLVKKTNSTGDWWLQDNMRGFTAVSVLDGSVYLKANSSAAESIKSTTNDALILTSTGFTVPATSGDFNSNGSYIYIAIRRGPMKTPTTGTSVFAPVFPTSTTTPSFSTGWPVDLAMHKLRASASFGTNAATRLQGTPELFTSDTAAESTDTSNVWSSNSGYGNGFTVTTTNIGWMFRRAPGFMDVVCYTGNSVIGRTINHNLTVAPELMFVKNRSFSGDWIVYSRSLGGTKYMVLNSSNTPLTSSVAWANTDPTATIFTVGSNAVVNASNQNYVAYLFASCPGVSKVGSYTGTGTTQQINCGFTGGARFVLIKKTSGTGSWYVWDSARGIVAGNDPYLLLNSTAAEVTSTDYIDTYSAGFEISSTAPAEINASGGTFIFLAIA